MRKFNYEAKDTISNKVVKAVVQAESEHQAAKLLIDRGLNPTSIKEADLGSSLLDRLTHRISTKDKVVFTRQLATLIAAGLPLSQSLNSLVDQTQNPRLRGVVQEIIASVEGGSSLHDAFAKHSSVFDRLFLALVAAGEASGTLDKSLQDIAAQQEKDAVIMSRIKGALTYPIIVLFVILGVLVFMLVTVVPQVQKLYKDLHQSLPLITEIIVSVSQFVIVYWWAVVLVVGLIVFGGIRYFRTSGGQRSLDAIKLNIPLFNSLFRRLYMARFTRTGETLLKSGVGMLDMLAISGDAVSNSIIGDEIKVAATKVKGGKELSVALGAEGYFPQLVPQMISIGEKSGRIDEMLGKTAKIYEDELEEEIRTISTAIEPVLMVILAIVAGGMVAAILLPIYGLVNTMNV